MSGKAIVTTAKSLLGIPYVYGGASKSGFDCSGFVQYVLKQHGISVPHSSDSIYKGGKNGSGAAGDVVCWSGHCGICDGAGNVIHAYGTKNGKVKINAISDVSRWDNRKVLGYRRYW